MLSGWGWDRFVPKRFHAAAPFRVIYLVQSFGSIDPRDSRYRHLANPAIRICVSKPLEQELRRLGAANGPVHTIPAGLDLAAMPKPACPPETDVLIVGFKKPDVARLLAEHLTQSGVTSTLFMGKRARPDFLAEMARARVVVCLPGTREGFYLPALEAMAVGALTVCPDARGNDYCRDGFNCFKPEYDVAALARAVSRASRLSADQAAEICRNASATARQHDLALERTRFLRVLRAALGA